MTIAPDSTSYPTLALARRLELDHEGTSFLYMLVDALRTDHWDWSLWHHASEQWFYRLPRGTRLAIAAELKINVEDTPSDRY